MNNAGKHHRSPAIETLLAQQRERHRRDFPDSTNALRQQELLRLRNRPDPAFQDIIASEQEMAVLGSFRIAPARIRARYEERNRGYEGGYALPVRYQDELDDSMRGTEGGLESARDYVRHYRHTNDDGAWPTDDPEAEIEGIDDVHRAEGWLLANQVAEAERDALKDALEMA